MNMKQARHAAVLGAALSITSAQVAAFEQLVEQQPSSVIEQDADYEKNKNLTGWGWNQKLNANTNNSDSNIDNTQQKDLPKIENIEPIERFLFEHDTVAELALILNVKKNVPNQKFNILVNQDGNGWQLAKTVYTGGEVILEDVTVSDQAEVAVQPCLNDDSVNCNELYSAGFTHKVPYESEMGWPDQIEAQVHTFAANSRVTGIDKLLEKGYDMVRNGMNINAHCFTTPPGEQHTSYNKFETDQSFELITERDKAINILDKDNTIKGSASLLGLETKDNVYKNKLYEYAMQKRDKSLFMGKFRHISKTLVSRPSNQLHLQHKFNSMLINGDKSSFRSLCGDQYIASVDIGKEMYYYIRVLNEEGFNYKKKDLETKFAAKFKELVSSNFDSNKKETFLNDFANFNLEIKSVSAGAEFAGSVVSHNSLPSFIESLKKFSDVNTSFDNYTAIGFTTNNYPIPNELTNKPLNEIFMDYSPIVEKIATWSNFNAQVEDRCDIYGPHSDGITQAGRKISRDVGLIRIDRYKRPQYDICNAVRSKIIKEYGQCLAQRTWSSCIDGPKVSSCKIGNTNCHEYAMEIHRWEPVEKTATLNVKKPACGAVQDCEETFWVETCLHPDYVLDYRVNFGYNPSGAYDRVAEGVSVAEHYTKNVGRVKTDLFSQNGQQCARLSAVLVTLSWWRNTAEYIGDVTMHGFNFIPRVPYQ
ncbi:hypothetical protein PA25_21230 [Pseudoalteromonas sp. A25]|uniref:hypothetical protein n=1 Tax=Pseudoalteromonas sp. A25 TaxID=116092 RepID=UPI0012612EBE|nr:hypothetical protein [Pseudoalteromonas sp. A25]BBN82138.1 hypothetical protein PA25_21230 [Pseudoalteromonas sp. A25]